MACSRQLLRLSFLFCLVVALAACGSSSSDDPVDMGPVECSNDGGVTVAAASGNTIEHGSGPWGVRAENSYVLDVDDGVIYIVPYVEVDPMTMLPFDDRTPLYTCDQVTGAEIGYTRVDGVAMSPNLLGHAVVFFSTFNEASTYLANGGMCAPGG